MESSSISIDQSPLMPVHRPAAVAELNEHIKRARAAKEGVYPTGGRTTLDIGLPLLKPGFAIDTTALNQVIDYPARDMTITVQAGISIAKLQAELEKEGQWLPIDVPEPEKATLGGAIALNQSGPHRYGYGTLRDYVIGISFATDDGVEVKAGGRVVKNVAGYDLMKLQIGALGTLGIVTQVTLKVKPRPESRPGVVFGCSGESLASILDLLHASKTRPAAVELLNSAAAASLGGSANHSNSEWMIAVGFEEKALTVKWQVATLLDELKGVPVRDVKEIPDASQLWAAITGMQVRRESSFIARASVPSSKLTPYVLELLRKNKDVVIHAHALNGVVWFHFASEMIPSENQVLRRCPMELKMELKKELKNSHTIWGKPGADWELMRHVKQTLDPDNVFNPGRLFGDL